MLIDAGEGEREVDDGEIRSKQVHSLYSNAGNDTLCSFGYRQISVKLTPPSVTDNSIDRYIGFNAAEMSGMPFEGAIEGTHPLLSLPDGHFHKLNKHNAKYFHLTWAFS